MLTADPRLEQLAATVRRSEEGDPRLSIRATADALDIDVRHAALGRALYAATYGETIVLNSDERVSPARRRFAFAHEVGHVLVRRGRLPWVQPPREELWAEWFAHELILPRRWLAERPLTVQLHLFDEPVEIITLALQLTALQAGAPRVFRMGEGVLCSFCGETPFTSSCRCNRYRNDGTARVELPEFIFHTCVHIDQLQLFEWPSELAMDGMCAGVTPCRACTAASEPDGSGLDALTLGHSSAASGRRGDRVAGRPHAPAR